MLKLEYCPTGEGGGVDPTCSPDGVSNGGASSTQTRRKRPKAKAELVAAADGVEVHQASDYTEFDELKETALNKWVLDPENDYEDNWDAEYSFKTPSDRKFTVRVSSGELEFSDETFRMQATGAGEAHHIFSEVMKATVALAKKTDAPILTFNADTESLGRQKLYSRLATSLAEIIPGAEAKISDHGEFGTYYKVKLRALPKGVKFAFCPTGEGGGVDPTCSPKTAHGSSQWPEEMRKKLRALQSRLSRAKTPEAKAKVALAINALIAGQSAPKPGASAKDSLLEAAKHVPIKKLPEGGLEDFAEWNTWGTEAETSVYLFKTPSGRPFQIMLEDNHLLFTDDEQDSSTTGRGEAHHIFSEVAKATAAIATRTNIDQIYFTADSDSKGRQRLYSRLASSLAALVPNAKAQVIPRDNGSAAYMIQLRSAVKLAFCPTGPGGGVDPTCSPANAGTGQQPTTPRLRVNQWPDVDRRALRALQSRLSRATTPEAKAVVRAQIENLRRRVESIHAQLQSPINNPQVIAAQAAAHAQAQAVKKDALLAKTDAELASYLSNLKDPPEYDANWQPMKDAVRRVRNPNLTGDNLIAKAEFDNGMKQLFGAHVTEDDHARLLLEAVGADKRLTDQLTVATVRRLNGYSNGSVISVRLGSDKMDLHRYLKVNHNGVKTAENAYFKIDKDLQKSGIGVRVFSQQVQTLGANNFEYIETTAASGGMVGYKVWPKFGYDWEMGYSDRIKAKEAGVYRDEYVDKAGRKFLDGQATLGHPEGAKWWDKAGSTTHMYFNLGNEHASRAVLDAYREKKAAELEAKLSVKLAFCPTGPGGGVDPTCSPANAGTALPALKKAKGTKNWPDAAKKKLRALQSKLSRAKTAQAKAIVIKAINEHIDAQNPQTAPAPAPTPAASVPKAYTINGVFVSKSEYDAHVAAQNPAQAANVGLTKVDTKVSPALNAQAVEVEKFCFVTNREDGGHVKWYTQSGSVYVNNTLRGKTTATSESQKQKLDSAVASLDKMMEKFGAPHDMIVTRAVGSNTQAAWLEGVVHTEEGYMSTSATAVRHVGYNAGWDKKTRCIISVPKGTNGAYLPNISAYPKEREFLLARGLKYRITRREELVPKARAANLLYGDRPGVTPHDLGHNTYTIIHMQVEE